MDSKGKGAAKSTKDENVTKDKKKKSSSKGEGRTQAHEVLNVTATLAGSLTNLRASAVLT